MRASERPTRIISEPVQVGTGKQGHPAFIYSCDNGQSYTAEEMRNIIGLSLEGLRQRLVKDGWQSEHLFLPSGPYKSMMMKKAHANKPVKALQPRYVPKKLQTLFICHLHGYPCDKLSKREQGRECYKSACYVNSHLAIGYQPASFEDLR